MAASTESTGEDSVKPLPPPTEKELRVKDKWLLILQVAYLIIKILPQIILAACRKLFKKPKSLRGQITLVTGAGRGLGRGLALALAQEGCIVAVADVNMAAAEDVASEIRELGGNAKAYYCNVARVEEVTLLRTIINNDFGPVDLLVNNAGLILFKPVLECSQEEITGIISVNLLSHFWMVKEFLPSMIERNSGHIVAISSLTSYVGGDERSAYAASKFGVTGFMESVRAEINKTPNNNIQTTTVCPYYINTSADYVKSWDLRIPAKSIEEVVVATIAGIRRDEVIITIPGYAHYSIHLLRLLPQATFDCFEKVFYARNVPPATQEKTPTIAIIEDLVKKK